MATYTQLPGTMNIALKRADSFSTVVDFDGLSLVGYTATATVTSLITGTAVATMVTSIVDAAAAQVSVGLTSSQTAGLAAGTYGWRLNWVAPGGVSRAALQGTVEVYA
jgi:hypothetical protein